MKFYKRYFTLTVFLLIVTVLLTIFYAFSTGWFSFLILWGILFVGSIAYLRSSFKEKNVVLAFVLPFCVYSLYMYITNYLFVENPYIDFFMMVDSKKFWGYSDYKLRSFSDVISAQQGDYVETIRYTLFNFGNLCVSFFAQIFDENNILIQKLQSVWLGAFSIPFVYLSFKKYFSANSSLAYAIIYAIFTHVCIYSVVFNRDPHVYLLYTIAIYIVVHHNTIRNGLGKMLILFVLICGFRLEHGLFFLTFVLLYSWIRSEGNGKVRILVVVMIPLAIAIMLPFLFGKYQDNTDSYGSLMERVERTEASAAVALSNLPPVIKEALMAVNSQLAPAVPFWRYWYPSLNQMSYSKHPVEGYFTAWRFPESIANILWVYIWGIIICGLFLKKYKSMPNSLNLLFIVAFLLLMAASTSVNARRTYCVYPIIFMYSIYIYHLLSPSSRRKVLQFTTIGLIGIYLLYYNLKFF